MVNGLIGKSESMIVEFEKRAKRIEDKKAQELRLGIELERVTAQITGVRAQWEPELDALVAQISAAFADNFSRIQCVGEVGIHKDEDFSQWAIHIKVKFRSVDSLSVNGLCTDKILQRERATLCA